MNQPALHYAMSLLARREHSRAELCRKLEKKGCLASDIISSIDILEAKTYLSECRFIGCRIRFRVRCGMGPLKILSEFQMLHQIEKSRVVNHESWKEIDWLALTQDVRDRKYGEPLPQKPKEIAIELRFLQQRGFLIEHIKKVMKL